MRGKGMYLKPYSGRGLLNTLINTLPVNLTMPSMNYCGPGNPIKKQLANKVPPKNKLDAYCREHDIFYLNNPNVSDRNRADMKLADQAWSRFQANDASFAEKAAAYLVTNLIKAKAKLGMGLKFNKKYGQLPAAKRITKHTLLSGCVSKKPVKKSKSKAKRKRNS